MAHHHKRRWSPRRRRLAIAALLLLGLGAAGTWAMLAMMPAAIIDAPNARRTIDPAQDPAGPALRSLGVSRQLRVAVGPPAASLYCRVLEPPSGDPRGTVLVLHGIRDTSRSLLGLGKHLARAGFRAVLPDLRGHGRSTGRWLSYGAIESTDLTQLLDALQTRQLLAPPVGAMGFSYGAATAIQLAGRDRRIRAVVAVSSFTSLHQVVRSYLRFYVPVLGRAVPGSIIDQAIDEAGRQAGFDPLRASPLRAIRSARAHILLIYGGKDRRIPPANGQALHHAAPETTELLVIPDENHATILGDRSGTVRREGLRWLNRWMTAD